MSPTSTSLHQSIYMKNKHLKELNASDENALVDEDSVNFAPGSSTELIQTHKDITRTTSSFHPAKNLGF